MDSSRKSNKYVGRITLTSQNCIISGTEVHEDGTERQYSTSEIEQLLINDPRELELFIADRTICLDKLVAIVKRLVPVRDHVYINDVIAKTGEKIISIMVTRWNSSVDHIGIQKKKYCGIMNMKFPKD
jgi:hypothetical protein